MRIWVSNEREESKRNVRSVMLKSAKIPLYVISMTTLCDVLQSDHNKHGRRNATVISLLQKAFYLNRVISREVFFTFTLYTCNFKPLAQPSESWTWVYQHLCEIKIKQRETYIKVKQGS